MTTFSEPTRCAACPAVMRAGEQVQIDLDGDPLCATCHAIDAQEREAERLAEGHAVNGVLPDEQNNAAPVSRLA